MNAEAKWLLDDLVAEALDDRDVLTALAEEHLSPDDARTALTSDTELAERLAADQAGFLKDPGTVIGAGEVFVAPGFVVGEFAHLRPAHYLRLAVAFGLVFGYHLLLFRAWPHLPAGLAVFAVLGYFATTAWGAHLAYRWIAPIRAAVDRITAPPHHHLWRAQALTDILHPAIADVIERAAAPPDSTELAYRAVENLYADSPSAEPVITAAGEQLGRAINRSETGAIALAGHRGVGKTTAIRHVAAGVLGDGDGLPLTVIASAPARYDARDFVLYLHALLCKEVLAHTRELPLRTVFTRHGRAVRSRKRFGSRRPVDRELRDLHAVAGQQLRRIRFLQTYTTGWSGKLTLPLKSEAGWTRSTQSAEQQLSYPEVVDEFRAFAEHAADVLRGADVTDRVVIAIDELDKIAEPEKAQELINDIKGIFDVPGCLFLVSVSDDAIISFERRGIPARDAFDSAFSEMIRLDNFTPDDTRNWIRRRVFGLPEQFGCLCHCLSGGLPRDLRRTVVDLLDVPAGQSLSSAVELLVRRDLDRKAHAFTGVARAVEPSAERSSLIADLVSIPAVQGHAELRALAAKILAGDGLDALRSQAAAYLDFCATIREVFTDDLTTEALYGVPGGEPQLLALARQQMAFDPRVSMDLLAKFRAARGLAVE